MKGFREGRREMGQGQPSGPLRKPPLRSHHGGQLEDLPLPAADWEFQWGQVQSFSSPRRRRRRAGAAAIGPLRGDPLPHCSTGGGEELDPRLHGSVEVRSSNWRGAGLGGVPPEDFQTRHLRLTKDPVASPRL